MNGEGTVDDLYFEWLYSHVGSVKNRNPSRSFWKLTRQLYTTPFFWHVPNDHNRAEDGKQLRLEFLDEVDAPYDGEWMSLDCSIFEMLIALSRRVAFESYGESIEWFWRLLENLNIHIYTDAVYDRQAKREIDRKLKIMVSRSYSRNGVGGLFPIMNSERDQRWVEIWYQMQTYLLESDYLNNDPQR